MLGEFRKSMMALRTSVECTILVLITAQLSSAKDTRSLWGYGHMLLQKIGNFRVSETSFHAIFQNCGGQ
jgi:hypothetical protein